MTWDFTKCRETPLSIEDDVYCQLLRSFPDMTAARRILGREGNELTTLLLPITKASSQPYSPVFFFLCYFCLGPFHSLTHPCLLHFIRRNLAVYDARHLPLTIEGIPGS